MVVVERSAATGTRSEQAVARAVGRVIAKRREELGLTRGEVARAIGCDRSAICHWELGRRVPTVTHLVALGRVLGCGAVALLRDVEPESG